jgi:uncharacterized RDD family membrane protein YckC
LELRDKFVHYAGFWRRVGSSLLDELILLVPTLIVLGAAPRGASQLLLLLIPLAYGPVMIAQRREARTLGMQVTHAGLQMTDGSRVTLPTALYRAALRLVLTLPSLYVGVTTNLPALNRDASGAIPPSEIRAYEHFYGLMALAFIPTLASWLTMLVGRTKQTLPDRLAHTVMVVDPG